MNREHVAALVILMTAASPLTAQIAGHVVISEVYGSGGNAGAVYQNDYVELYNPTYSAVTLAGWSVQYASATGTAWHAAPLGGRIPSFGYYLVQLAGGTNGIALPQPDTTGSMNISATAGKIALVRNTALLSGANPVDTALVDMVGYGTADLYEGGGPAPAPGTTTSIERKASPQSTAADMAPGGIDVSHGNGWDSNNNAADFVAQKSLSPQNSSAALERPPDALLPIRFGTLDASLRDNATTLVSWSTISENGCYGFEVQRSVSGTGGFITVSGLIPGHGTTILAHSYSYIDSSVMPGRYYRVRELDTNGAEWFSESVFATPVSSAPEQGKSGYSLFRNYPNPFNPMTTIGYTLSTGGRIKIIVMDVLGRVVATLKDGRENRGEHTVRWDAGGVPSGVYFCRLESEGQARTIRLVLIR